MTVKIIYLRNEVARVAVVRGRLVNEISAASLFFVRHLRFPNFNLPEEYGNPFYDDELNKYQFIRNEVVND